MSETARHQKLFRQAEECRREAERLRKQANHLDSMADLHEHNARLARSELSREYPSHD